MIFKYLYTFDMDILIYFIYLFITGSKTTLEENPPLQVYAQKFSSDYA